MFRVKVLADSIAIVPSDAYVGQIKRAISFLVRYPRIVLAEDHTHRRNSWTWGEYSEVSWCERSTGPEISKNSASSRAIPLSRVLDGVRKNPYIPQFTANQGGMQGAFVDANLQAQAEFEWLLAMDAACKSAERLSALGIHKQDCNRLLEPWVWIEQVVTSSNWDNYYALRCDAAAHPAIQRLARMMYIAQCRSKPLPLGPGMWHLPFVSRDESAEVCWVPQLDYSTARCTNLDTMPYLLRASAARCAWVSYANHDKDATEAAVERTWQRLVGSSPAHASPQEHQLTPLERNAKSWCQQFQGNMTGYIQLRKLLPHEVCTEYKPNDEEVASWNLNGPLWVDD